jgi:hypothetical protein
MSREMKKEMFFAVTLLVTSVIIIWRNEDLREKLQGAEEKIEKYERQREVGAEVTNEGTQEAVTSDELAEAERKGFMRGVYLMLGLGVLLLLIKFLVVRAFVWHVRKDLGRAVHGSRL